MRSAILAMLLVACDRGARPVSGDTATVPLAESQAVARTDSTAAAPAPGARPPCPATGAWAECSVFERLDRAGLAPRRDSAPASEPPLTQRGQLLRVGNGELEVYLYAHAAARESDEAKLDRDKYAAPDKPLGMRPLPTLIRSANLIAILHSRNEHLRERVSDALTAGPPQPPKP